MTSRSFQRTIAAPPEVVFDVLTDHVGYTAITPLRSVKLECEGHGHRDGVGAIRVVRPLGRWGPAAREEVVTYERPERFAYRIVSGLPVRDHEGAVRLAATARGTQLRYRWEATPSALLPGPVLSAGVRVAIGWLIRSVADEAERRAREQ